MKPSGVRPIRRLLLSAYACDPNSGSEPGAGWAFLKASLRSCDNVTVLTRTKNRGPIIRGLSAHERNRVHILVHDLPAPLRWLKHRLRGGTQLYYLCWQLSAVSKLRRIHREDPFDLAHHVTFAADWQPCALAYQENLPFIWGPVGGSQYAPGPLRRYLGWRGRLTHGVRRLVTKCGHLFFGKPTGRACSQALAMNTDVAAVFSSICPTEVFPNPVVQSHLRHRIDPLNTQILGVGSLLPLKGWALALAALRHLPEKFHLLLAGDGPDKRRLQRHAQYLGVSDRITFLGSIPRTEVFQLMVKSRCLLHPTFHDSSSWVAAEAVAFGLPVVALDLPGPREVLKNSENLLVDWRAPNLDYFLANAVLTAPLTTQPINLFGPQRIAEFLPELYQRLVESS